MALKTCWYVLDRSSPVVIEDLNDGSFTSYIHKMEEFRRLGFKSEMCVRVMSAIPPADSIVVFEVGSQRYYIRQGDMHTEVAQVVH